MNTYARGKFDSNLNKKAYGEYTRRINKKTTNPKEAIEDTKKILGIVTMPDGTEFTDDEFWRDVFEQGNRNGYINIHLESDDMLYSETQMAKSLEAFASNILKKDKADRKERKITVYHSSSLYKKALKDQARLNNIARNNGGECMKKDEEFTMLVIPKNYKLTKLYDISDVQKILEEFGHIPTIKNYCDEYIRLSEMSKAAKEKKNLALLCNNTEEVKTMYFLLKKLFGIKKELKKDIDLAMRQIIKPIIWKNPLKDTGCNDYDWVDFFDLLHIEKFLQLEKTNEVGSDLNCILLDLEILVKNCELTHDQRVTLEMWREKATYKQIGKVLGVSEVMIFKNLRNAFVKISEEYERRYSDWYYLNIVKGKYKKCKCCKQNKLITEYFVNNRRKDNLETCCKPCFMKKRHNAKLK